MSDAPLIASADGSGPFSADRGPSARSHGELPGVVSFVRRSPRMNQSQQKALNRLAGEYLIELPHGALSTSIAPGTRVDWDVQFGSAFAEDSPIFVEIGSGTGDALVACALAHPDARIVGFEVYERALASTMSKLAAADVHNVRLVMADAVQGLESLFAEGSITRISTFFPDPWPKKRHHKRRLVSPTFARLAAGRLAIGGEWWLATDWPDYADQMREVLDATGGLANLYPAGDGLAPRPAERPITKFERRGLDAGRPVADLAYRRVS